MSNRIVNTARNATRIGNTSTRAKTLDGVATSKALDAPAVPLVNVAALIDESGEINIGSSAGIPCVATANDGHNTLAMLARRRGESFFDLLVRLDSAIEAARERDEFIDEVNRPR